MVQIGPIVSISSMRFEAKHQIFKKVAYISNNRINILKTLNIKNQIKIANSVLNYSELLDTSITHGSTKQLKDFDWKKYKFKPETKESTWLNYYHLHLKKNMVICIDIYNDHDPIFALINNIVSVDGKYYLGLQSIDTNYFDSHFFAYNVILNLNTSFVRDVAYLKHYFTSHISKSANGNEYVI